MASKFDRAKGAQGIKDVAQASNEKANLITIKYYKDDDLLDYTRNNEDVSDTEDIEKSIEEQGFTDPIEITDFGHDDGKFTIVSGHRRRIAGRKKGMKDFPCILRHFKSESEVYNYVLYSNAQRDSAKDPLLFAKRYKMHEEYLKESGFTGSLREEIAKRLGLKPAQADRYNQMNKVILPVWDMLREGTVGMSSITDSGMYTHSPQEQTEILQIMKECIESTSELTRPTMKKIVSGYRSGKRTWLQVIQVEMEEFINPPEDNTAGISVMSVNADIAENSEKEPSPLERNNEVKYDYGHREGLPSGVDPLAEERPTEEDFAAIEKASENEKKEEKGKKPPLTEEEKKLQAGDKVSKEMTLLEGLLNDFYTFKDKEQAELSIKTMASLSKLMFGEMERIAEEYEIMETFEKMISDVSKEAEIYKG